MTTRPILHFVHGNSFPAGAYRALFEYWRPNYDVQALEMHGHNPQYPVTDGWPFLVQELIDTLLARYQEPVILVGHSLGGILCWLAAHQRPDLVRCVVMIDSPILGGWRALFVKILKRLKFAKRFFPARYSERRRILWPNVDAAHAHFLSKEKFAMWHPTVLQDYLSAGLIAHSEGVALTFSREIETAIYLTLPDHLGTIAKSALTVPVGFVGGMDSIECRQAGMALTKKSMGENFFLLDGGHLLPMEKPQQTANHVHEMIMRLIAP
jgi:pimeloyl-ACP methyl ester carboxylesterase